MGIMTDLQGLNELDPFPKWRLEREYEMGTSETNETGNTGLGMKQPQAAEARIDQSFDYFCTILCL